MDDVDTLFPPDQAGGGKDLDALFPPEVERERARRSMGSSPIQDLIFGDTTRNPAARVLDAFGQGFSEGWGTQRTGLSKETTDALKRGGWFNDYEKGQHSIIKAANEVLMRGAAVAWGAGSAAFGFGSGAFRGAQATVAQVGEELGYPRAARELAAYPEAFMGSPHPTGITRASEAAVDLAKARRLGIIGEGEAGWKGTVDIEPKAVAPEPVIEPVEPPSPSGAPAVTDVHSAARQLDFEALRGRPEAQTPEARAGEAAASGPAAPAEAAAPGAPEAAAQTPAGAQAPGRVSAGPPASEAWAQNLHESVRGILDAPEVTAAIQTPRIDRTHDVPYGAGSSAAGGTTYVDRRIPESWTIDGKTIDPGVAVNIHEQAERHAMEVLGMSYEEAHKNVGTPAEKAWVESQGISWDAYQKQWDGALEGIEHENPKDPPKDLYLKPYTAKLQDTLRRAGATGEGAAVAPGAPEAASAATPAAAPIEGAVPNGISTFRPQDLTVDAARFQFKADADELGVSDRLKGVTTWDPIKAGMVLVWQDNAGHQFIVDGHQRVALAKRIAQADPAQDPRLNAWVLKEGDGTTDQMARAIAAMKNIAEGTGTAIDAAKVIRDHPELASELPPRSELVRQARGLVNLSDEAFGMVVNEVVPPNYAAIVGRLVPSDGQLQSALLQLLAKTEPANIVQAEAIVRQGIEAGTHVETQASLFGDTEVATSLYLDRAKVLDRALKLIKRDKAVFEVLSKEQAAIEAAGNKLATDINAKRASADAQALQILQALASRKGPISDALTAAARSAREGGSYAGASRDFVEAVRRSAESGDLNGLADGLERGPTHVGAESTAGVEPAPAAVTAAEEEAATAKIEAALEEARAEPGLFGEPPAAAPRETSPFKTETGAWRTFYRGLWGPDAVHELSGGIESYSETPHVAGSYAHEPNDAVLMREHLASGQKMTPRVASAELHSQKPFVMGRKASIGELKEKLGLTDKEVSKLVREAKNDFAKWEGTGDQAVNEAWNLADTKYFQQLLRERGYDAIALRGAFVGKGDIPGVIDESQGVAFDHTNNAHRAVNLLEQKGGDRDAAIAAAQRDVERLSGKAPDDAIGQQYLAMSRDILQILESGKELPKVYEGPQLRSAMEFRVLDPKIIKRTGEGPSPQTRAEIQALIDRKASPQEIASHPFIQRANELADARPHTEKLPGYGTPEFEAKRQFNFKGEKIVGYDAYVDRLVKQAESYSTQGPVKQERIATIVLGPPASGKSRLSERIAADTHSAIADSDDAKLGMPEYDGGLGTPAVHEESATKLAPRVLRRLLDENKNVVLPLVGANPEKIRARMQILAEGGYKINLVNLDVAEDEAYRRMIGRFLSTGRIIGSEYFESVDGNPKKTYYILKGEQGVKEAVDIDGNGPASDTFRVIDGAQTELGLRLGGGGGSRPTGRDAGVARGEEAQSAAAARITPSLHIADDVATKLVAAGRPEDEAQAAGQLIAAYWQTRAERFEGKKGTADELYRAEGPEIKAGKTRGAAAREPEMAQTRKGRIRLREDAGATITLLKDADASTFIHETGHEWLDRLLRDAKDPVAPETLKTDASTVLDWLNVKNVDDVKVSHHERFARGFETYMSEGRAPTSALAGVFAKFKEWLGRIYQSVKNVTPINDAIRGVLDRMLAVPDQTLKGAHERKAAAAAPEQAGDLAETLAGERGRIAEQLKPGLQDVGLPGSREVDAEAAQRPPGDSQPGGPRDAPESDSGPGVLDTADGGVGARGTETAQDGARLSAQSGKPTEPPTTAHGTFPRAESRLVDKAGNIRLDNLATPQDVSAVIRETAVQNDDFIAARRGVVSDAQVLELADALGMDARKLSARKMGEAYNAEQIMAARKLLIQSATQVRDAMVKAADGEEAEILAYAEAKARHQMIQEHVAGITAEAGRALRAFRFLEGTKETKTIGDFLQANTGQTLYQLQQEAKLGAALDSPAKVSKFVRDSTKPGFWDMLLEYWVNGLISGPATHTTYATGNELLALNKAGPETAVAAAIGSARQVFGDGGPRVYWGEVPAQLFGMVKGTRQGVIAAWESLKSGQTKLLPGELENMTAQQAAYSPMINPKAATPDFKPFGIPIPLGTVIRLPSRGVAIIHSFFRAVNYQREMAALAYRTAAEEGLSGDAFARRVGEVMTDPSPEQMKEARASATDLTLMGKGGDLTRAISGLTSAKFLGFQWLKFIDPFVHISSNVIEQAVMQRTPVGILDPEIRATLMGANGPVARDMAIARMVVGSAIGVAVGSLAAEGRINGSGPSDPKEASIYTMVNGPPHSVRIGDTWYDIHRLGPLGMNVSIMADLYEVAHMIGKEDGAHVAHAMSHAFTHNILDESFLRGPADLMKALSDGDRYGASYVRNFLSSFTPYSVGSSQIARAIDPYSRSARTILDAVKAKVPWLSQTLLPRRDIFGEPIPSKEALGIEGLSAIYEAKVNRDPVPKALLEAKLFPGMPQRKLRGVELTDQQYDDLVRIGGRMSKMRLNAIVNMPGFAQMPENVRHDLLQKADHGARETAGSLILMQNPSIVKAAMDAKIEKLKPKPETVH
jgi:hypothetical protein